MSVLLTGHALLGIPVGLLLGMALGPVANREHGAGGYGSFPRRAARLGHVAAVMLPLLSGFYALAARALGAPVPPTAAGLWVVGAVLLVLVLFLAAFRPRARYLLPLPATSLVVAAGWFAVSLLPSIGGVS